MDLDSPHSILHLNQQFNHFQMPTPPFDLINSSPTFTSPPTFLPHLPHSNLTTTTTTTYHYHSSNSNKRRRRRKKPQTQKLDEHGDESHHNPKVVAAAEKNNNKLEDKKKRIKLVVAAADDNDDGEESKITGQSKDNNCGAAADTSLNSKPDYIHVRARRGQATDSHSLAERVRREKISEKMKFLQGLVPGCNKVTGKAGMLDEIINYVQSLQQQVEFLSMKLATVNPRRDFNIDDMFNKEVLYPTPPTTSDANASLHNMVGMSSEMINHPLHQLISTQKILSYSSGLDTGMNMNTNPSDAGLRRTISAPVSLPESTTFFDHSSCFNQQTLPISSTTWEADFQSLYNWNFDQARGTSSFPSHLFNGN